jgi:hypothetical protein
MTSPELVVLRRGVRRSGTAALKLALLELVLADRVSLLRRRRLVRSEAVLLPRVDPDAVPPGPLRAAYLLVRGQASIAGGSVSLRTFALAAQQRWRHGYASEEVAPALERRGLLKAHPVELLGVRVFTRWRATAEGEATKAAIEDRLVDVPEDWRDLRLIQDSGPPPDGTSADGIDILDAFDAIDGAIDDADGDDDTD